MPLTFKHPQTYQTRKSKSSHNYIDSPTELFCHVPVDKSNYLETKYIKYSQAGDGAGGGE